MPKFKPIVVCGNSYNSISEAWRAEAHRSLPEITVRVRLKLGWHPDDAFKVPAVPPQLRRTFKKERNDV